eukprot:736469-Prorocentrum_minimum.AAC.1
MNKIINSTKESHNCDHDQVRARCKGHASPFDALLALVGLPALDVLMPHAPIGKLHLNLRFGG